MNVCKCTPMLPLMKIAKGLKARLNLKIGTKFFHEIFEHFLWYLLMYKYFVKTCNAKVVSNYTGFRLISRKKGWPLKLGAKRAVKSSYNNSLLNNNLLLFIEAKMFIVGLFMYTVPYLSHMLRNKGFQGARNSKFWSLIYEKGEIFWKAM